MPKPKPPATVTTDQAEIDRLRATLKRGVELVREMDARMPEQATSDADGFINSYRIPVGPWHRLLGWIVEADYVRDADAFVAKQFEEADSPGLGRIEAEQARQRELGWSAEHDREHTGGEWLDLIRDRMDEPDPVKVFTQIGALAASALDALEIDT